MKDIISADKFQAIGEIPIIISTLFSRVSVCLFLLRIFAVNVSWRWTLYIIIALTAGTNIACGTAIMLRCQPLAKEWNPAIPGRCWTPVNQVAVGQIQGGESIAAETPQLSQRGRANYARSGLGVPGPGPLRLTYILHVEDTNELEKKSRHLWHHVPRIIVSLSCCIMNSYKTLSKNIALLVVHLCGLSYWAALVVKI